MKKIFTLSSLFVAAAMSLNAQHITSITSDLDAGELEALYVSNNGKYICGTTMSAHYFVYDIENRVLKHQAGPSDESGDAVDSQLRQITNDGLAIGYAGNYPITMDKDGNVTQLDTLANDADHACTIAFGISNDGKTAVGCAYSTYSVPVIWQDGKLSQLTMPTDEEVGYTVNGAVAKYVSADGSIVVGYIEDDMSTYPAIMWTRQSDGSYAVENISADYYEPGEGDLPYWAFTPQCISANGRYVGIEVQRNIQASWDAGNYDDQGVGLFCIYDTQDKTVTAYAPDGTHGLDDTSSFVPCGIADDGTVIGYTGSLWEGDAQGFIMRSSDKQPLLMTEVYSSVDAFSSYVTNGCYLPTSISADGKVITGYGANAIGYESFVFNTTDSTVGIGKVSNESVADAIVSRFSVDGKRLSAPTRGINIVKHADGRIEKVLVK